MTKSLLFSFLIFISISAFRIDSFNAQLSNFNEVTIDLVVASGEETIKNIYVVYNFQGTVKIL